MGKKYIPKLTTSQIQSKFAQNEYLNNEKSKGYKHQAKVFHHTINETKIMEMFLNTTASYRVARYINYKINIRNKNSNMAYEQIAYICKTSVKNVERVIRRLIEKGIILHELNSSRGNHISKTERLKNLCNPFKGIFRFIKSITNKLLIESGFRKMKQAGFQFIPKANIQSTTELVSWMDT